MHVDLRSKIEPLKRAVIDRFGRVVLHPIGELVEQNVSDVVTTIGSFVVRSVRGKFQRSITFTVGNNYANKWMEEALYGILYRYNDIKKESRLELTNKSGVVDGSGMYYQLDDGTHNLKYRDYNILLCIQSNTNAPAVGRVTHQRIYTIITYDLSPEFVKQFEADMLKHRNSLLKIRSDAPTVNVFQDFHEADGYTYWEKTGIINKRRLGTVYMPYEQKKMLVDTINQFFASKQFYVEHGIAHNLKILLYGPPGPQPVSAVIPTPDGMMPIGELEPGDMVFGIDGKPTKIEEIYDYEGESQVYRLEFSDGRFVDCDICHKFNLFNMVTNTVEDVSVADIIHTGLTDGRNFKYAAIIPKPVEFERIPAGPSPYMIGLLLGTSGAVRGVVAKPSVMQDENTPKRHFITFEKCDEPVFKIIANMFSIGYAYIDHKYMIPAMYGSSLYDNLTDHQVDCGILSETETDIVNIPFAYKYSDPDTRLSVLRGLIAATKAKHIDVPVDTSNTGHDFERIMIPKHRVRLMLDVYDIARSLGFIVSKTLGRQHYTMRLFGINEALRMLGDPTVSNRQILDVINQNTGKLIDLNKQLPLYLIDVNPIENTREKMRCLHVENPDHLYVTSGFVSTCNSGKDSIAKMIASEWNRNMYYVTGGKDGRFIPNAITDNGEDVNHPLFLISDVDKYPYLINEPEVTIEKEDAKEDRMRYKQLFGNMINALDGVLSGEDRIIIMTTNHIEKFSKTLLRPGRIDLSMEIGYVTPEVFREFTRVFYNVELPDDFKLNSKKLTIADLQSEYRYLKPSAEEFIQNHIKI